VETLDFLRSLPISYLHVFTFSERPNTAAITMQNVVPSATRKKRTHQLRRLSDQKRYDFDTAFLGTERPVLFEKVPKSDGVTGWTDNYIRVSVPGDASLSNQIVMCRLEYRKPGDMVHGSALYKVEAGSDPAMA
jgi:threonylcarbamoyladenosine tRNA methylthiotransferase MtaB